MANAVSDILKNSILLYGLCSNCEEIHGDVEKIAGYLQWLSNMKVIQFN